MKHLRKVMALVLAAFMALAIGVPALAADAGSITVTNAEVGKVYTLYKLFDATVAPDGSIAYSLPSGKDVTNDTFFNQYFEIKNGNIFKKDAFTETVVAGDAFKTWAASFGTQKDQKTATSQTVEFSPIDYGYYYITSSVGTVLTVDSANPHADVIDKNQHVDFDKGIVQGTNLITVNHAGLNDPIDFKIVTDSKNYEGTEKIFQYEIQDEMDPGFSLKAAPVVKVGSKTLSADDDEYTITYTKGGTATTTVTEADAFTITIPWTSDGTKAGTHLYANGDDIEVTYTAILDPAKGADVKQLDPNKNRAKVRYWKGNDTPNTPSGNLPWKETKTFNTGLTILKTDGTDKMTGAQFTLTSTDATDVAYTWGSRYVEDANGTYWKLKDDTYTAEGPTGDATHDAVYASTTTKYKLEAFNQPQGAGQTSTTIASYVDADGKVKFTGLGEGTYKIEETVVPAGYNKADDIEFTITFEPTTEQVTGADGTTVTKITGGKFVSNNSKIVLNKNNGVFETTIVNQKGTELPSTGGMGTTILYTIGGIMLVGGAIALVSKKRVANMEK